MALAREAGVELRQSYARLAPRLAMQVGRYAHAQQFRRMRKGLRKLKGYTGRVLRDLRRQLDNIPMGSLRDRIIARLALVSQLLHQEPKGRDKILPCTSRRSTASPRARRGSDTSSAARSA